MARGRFLSDSVAKDKRLNDLPLDAALVYMMTIPHLDRDGIIDGDTAVLWGTVCPRRYELLNKMKRIIGEWVAVGLVVRYETDEGTAIWFPGFGKNQKGLRYDRESPSRFPPPPGYVRINDGLAPEELRHNSGLTPDQVRRDAGVSPAQWQEQEQVEVKVEVKVKDQVEAAASAAAFSSEADAEDMVVKAWKANDMAGRPVGVLLEALRELTGEHGADGMLRAITIACERDRRTLAYVRGILRKGVNTPANGASPPGASPYAGMVLERDEDDEP